MAQPKLTPNRIRCLPDAELLAAMQYIWDHFASPLADALLAEIERRGLRA